MDLNKIVDKKDNDKALGPNTENSSQNKEKLEPLLSEFKKIINDEAISELQKNKGIDACYNYIYKKINDFDFDIKNVNLLTNNIALYDIKDTYDYIKNRKFGLSISALINKTASNGEKVEITTSIPVDYLFYKLENVEAHINIAGRYLGYGAKNSKIYVDEAEYQTGQFMENCELHVKNGGIALGSYANNSKIYADEAECSAGDYMTNCELYVKNGGIDLGYAAKNSKIYAEEAGKGAGSSMRNSELFIDNLKGKLYISSLKGKNKIYIGRESYYKHPLKYKLMGVKIWEKEA
jgi:hypothetical protein